VAKMVRALRKSKELSVQVTNYRKDGSAFANDLSLTPVRDSAGVSAPVITRPQPQPRPSQGQQYALSPQQAAGATRRYAMLWCPSYPPTAPRLC
jgi:hypothetical protein